jgi:hypothetical protein
MSGETTLFNKLELLQTDQTLITLISTFPGGIPAITVFPTLSEGTLFFIEVRI